jgi:O-antigen/teichoic acid export membrane protein
MDRRVEGRGAGAEHRLRRGVSIRPRKADVLWGYLGQVFSVASSLVTLPLILRMLTADEVGLNYLMVTISGFALLLDFGFSPQFARNFAFVFGGAQSLLKEGIADTEVTETTEVNHQLLANMIGTARTVYRLLGAVVLVLMLSAGTVYVYRVTGHFLRVRNSLLIWVVYSFSTFFSVYYSYFASLLIGRGKVAESRKALVYSRAVYVVLTFLLLFTGLGLLGVAIANLVAAFASRFISARFFFTPDLRVKLKGLQTARSDRIELFRVIWHNARKLGLVLVGSFAINKIGMFLAGLYLPLTQVAAYGLMLQLINLVSVVSSTLFVVYQPRFAALRVGRQSAVLLNEFSLSMGVFYLLFGAGCAVAILAGPPVLSIIGSQSVLPPLPIMLLYCLFRLLEQNHSNFATLIATRNSIPFVKPSLISGACIAVGSYVSLSYLKLGILGLVLVPGLVQLAYSNWKWPSVVFREFSISFLGFMRNCASQMLLRLRQMASSP